MDAFVKIFSEIQEIAWRAELDIASKLPEIVVVGGQSAGKSTVLEAIIGYEILPKGVGIQTRCPIRICMHKIREKEEYASCPILFDGRISIKEIKDKILAYNDIIAKKDYVTRKALVIHIFSPSVLNLTLVDTPGLTKIRLQEQPEDIVETIESIAREYSSNENSIILAISSANNDIATSDALRLALEVDKSLNRTIGVLTKIDMMNKGTNCLETMQNRQFKLNLGFIGVKCSSSRPNEPTDFEEIEGLEKRFFESHEIYQKQLDKFGIGALKAKLSLVFQDSIRKMLPDLESELRIKNAALKQAIAESSIVFQKVKKGKKQIIETNVSKANKIINLAFNELRNRVHGFCMNYSLEEVEGGAKIRKVLLDYQNEMDDHKNRSIETDLSILWENTNALEEHDVLKVNLITINLPYLFTYIEKTIETCLNRVETEFTKIIDSVNLEEFKTFNEIKIFFSKELKNVAKKNKKKTDKKLKFLVTLEKKYINPDDPEIKALNLSQKNIEAALELIRTYYQLSRKSLDKNVPKFIKWYYIDRTCDQAYSIMINKITEKEVSDSLFRQDMTKYNNYMKLKEEKKDIKQLLIKLEQIGSLI
jgi:GTPase SAR1 family protein